MNYRTRITLVGVCFLATILITACGAMAQWSKELHRNSIQPKGEWANVETPETLDLSKRAEHAIHYLTSSVEPDNGYQCNPRLCFGRQAPLTAWQLQLFPTGITPFMHLRALPLVRAMSGSDENLNIELEMMKAHLERIGENGLLYYPDGDGIIPTGTSYPNANGFTLLAVLNWYQRDKNPQWLEIAEKLAKGLQRTAIRIEDRAFYPPEAGVNENGIWHIEPEFQTKVFTKPPVEYRPPAEPHSDHVGYKGCVKYEQTGALLGLLADYEVRGDKASLETARQLMRFCLKPELWEEGMVWEGYFQGNMTFLQALLKYAIIEKNERLKNMVRRNYEVGRNRGVRRLGWFPYWTPQSSHGYPNTLSTWSEPCATANALILAVQLSENNLGDYWDDVDCYIRNQLIEQQFIDLEKMQSVSSKGSPTIEERFEEKSDPSSLLRRFVGGFGGGEPHSAGLIYMDKNALIDSCCSANSAIALYYAWRGITRFEDGEATVNLWLNRSAPWMDVQSWLPEEGKLVLRNKKAKSLKVRIPDWAASEEMECQLNGQGVDPIARGGYLYFDDLDAGDKIVISTDVPASVERFTIDHDDYEATFRGNTVIDIKPQRDKDPYIYPIYERDDLKDGKVQMLEVRRFHAKETADFR